jgi:cytidylate kinase
MGMVVTIDGPAASGKSTVSRELANRLGWQWVSTGAFYRALGYAALQMKIDITDVKALTELAHSTLWSVRMANARTQVFFKNHEVTDDIFSEDVGDIASKISHYPQVRKALLDAQRGCSAGPQGLVAEGRDCGTVVFPQAQAKIYLTASSEHRAARRAAELGLDQGKTQEAQKVRDQQDSTRKAAPLQVPDQALVVDTTEMALDEVVDKVEQFVRSKLN